jgi:hypothetical protein
VTRLWGASQTGSTPTLIVGYGGLWGEEYWYQKTNVWENQRLLSFTPRAVIDERSRRRTMSPDDEFNHLALAQNCKNSRRRRVGAARRARAAAGPRCALGAVDAAAGRHDEHGSAALRPPCNGARYLGLDKDLGSLERASWPT